REGHSGMTFTVLDLIAAPVLPGREQCPGHLAWSAFGASYPDTVCATACEWEEGTDPGAVLCDADDDFRPKDTPCPFCDPAGFIGHQWGGIEERTIVWSHDGATVDEGTEIHFHDGQALWWTATHPE